MNMLNILTNVILFQMHYFLKLNRNNILKSWKCFVFFWGALQLTFDAFSQREKDQWKRLMDNFYKEVEHIENEAKAFIDESFQSLRSAEGAFDMLLNFKHIRSREAINNQMMQKFRDILVQYGKEVWTSFTDKGVTYH